MSPLPSTPALAETISICQAPRGVSRPNRTAATNLFGPQAGFLSSSNVAEIHHDCDLPVTSKPTSPIFLVHSGPLWPFKTHSLRVFAAA